MHFIPLKEHIIYKKRFVYRGEKNERNEIRLGRKKIQGSSLKFYHEYGKDESLLDRQGKTYDYICPSYQLIGSGIIENTEIGKKVDKCIEKVEEGLKLLKGMVDYSEELQVDVASNYKRYFAKHNPDNLIYLNVESSKG
jgi:hypothetical protein